MQDDEMKIKGRDEVFILKNKEEKFTCEFQFHYIYRFNLCLAKRYFKIYIVKVTDKSEIDFNFSRNKR